MYIFDNVVWQKTNPGEDLYIGKAAEFYGKADNPSIADIAKANTVADYDILNEHLNAVKIARDIDSKDSKVILADKASRLRGYGAGLAIVVNFNDNQRLYLPHRDIGAPGDRLIWDACAGRTVSKDESPNWFHRMIMEGLEELTFTIGNYLLLPKIQGLTSKLISQEDAESITWKNAEVLGLNPNGTSYAAFNYVAPKNSSFVHHVTENGEIIELNSGWGIEAKYSGLELMAYGVINSRMDYKDVVAYDSEEFAPGKVCNREVHEINPSTGAVKVFHKGQVIREGNIVSEIERRNSIRQSHDYSKDRKGLVPIPEYSASIKADLLTKQDAWPFDSDISALKDIRFRG